MGSRGDLYAPYNSIDSLSIRGKVLEAHILGEGADVVDRIKDILKVVRVVP
jgi:hypothetical protein